MTKLEQWIVAFVVPFIIESILLSFIPTISGTMFPIWVFAPFGAIMGVFMISDYLGQYKIPIIIGFVVSLFLLVIGFQFRKKLWGKFMVSTGCYLWTFSGSMAFMMSY